MEKKEFAFSYEVYPSAHDLPAEESALLHQARSATALSYAPYSRFRVGAAARLRNGAVLTGSNQENASFPAGLCAERVLLAAAASRYPGVAVELMAISYRNENGASQWPISPCGICRQALQENEQRDGVPIRLVLGGLEGPVYVIEAASHLLPLAFTSRELS